MTFKLYNARKLNDTQKDRVLELLDQYHNEQYEIEKINNQLRRDNQPLVKKPSGASFIRQLQAEDIAYSKNGIYHDIRRNASFYKSRTYEKSLKAQNWFDNYFEPFRKAHGLTTKEAHALWLRAKTQSYENMTEAELAFAIELREIGSP